MVDAKTAKLNSANIFACQYLNDVTLNIASWLRPCHRSCMQLAIVIAKNHSLNPIDVC